LETEKEKMLADIWADILSVSIDEIGRNSSFFQLGGDSITAVKASSRARDIGLNISVSQLFSSFTLQECCIQSLEGPISFSYPEVSVSYVIFFLKYIHQSLNELFLQ
jgi:aryl carrier-like protein